MKTVCISNSKQPDFYTIKDIHILVTIDNPDRVGDCGIVIESATLRIELQPGQEKKKKVI